MSLGKPTNIDAQRIVAIMDELKEKLTYLSVVTSQVLDGLNSEEGASACELLGPDLMKQFSEQIRLEDKYVESIPAEGGIGQGEETEVEDADTAALKKNTLDLVRRMRLLPNVVQELRYHQSTEHRPAAMINFLKTLADMQELTLKRLTTTLEEEKSRGDLLDYYRTREEEASKRKQQLEKDLTHIRRESERAQSQRTEILTTLKAALADVRDSKHERMLALRTRFDTRMRQQHEEFCARKVDLEKRIKALNDSNTKQRNASLEDEANKKSKVKRFEKEVGDIITKYDDHVKDMAYMLNDYQERYKKEQKQLTELREHFEKVQQEKECIENEELVADARRGKIDREKKLRNDMSSLVQAFWRGITLREFFVNAKKGKGKKGGKKKK